MEIDIVKFVGKQKVSTEFEIDSVRLNNSAVWIFGRGQKFWQNSENAPATSPITLKLSGLSHSNLCISAGQKGDCTLSIDPDNGQEWTKKSGARIYCNSPITHPSSVLLAAESALETINLQHMLFECFGVEHGRSFNALNKKMKQESNMLTDNPLMLVHSAITAELDRQQTNYTVLETDVKQSPNFRVCLGDMDFFCEAISAIEFDRHELKPNEANTHRVGYSHAAA